MQCEVLEIVLISTNSRKRMIATNKSVELEKNILRSEVL